ncbi:sulfur carrier protein ThiS [Aestuariicella hydrocarbonica]|uniref:Sulfur carrier protein ThiS n=1 Tax=Pseudomaricurvus hydrocarbonicus TaxID=1470433 RepID=A0A9E5JXM6_9GAMM|nr:sulfur carrier protein ThiS [Aestuariicella hydrocarbonica]NHO66420.1 sulfur carrier protein ThiS [Aestuariicella hydrocarbonica]
MLTVSLNNEPHTLPGTMSLTEALAHWQLSDTLAAAAINGEFIPRSQYHQVTLSAGDQIDIVKPVGGG